MERYIAIDVETPNAANDRISAIGICTVEDGAIQSRFYTLVDPETYFAPFNVQLTGITPAMVQGQPTFSELWPFIRPMLESGVPVAHSPPLTWGCCPSVYPITTSPGKSRSPLPAPVKWAGGCCPSCPIINSTPFANTWRSPWSITMQAATARPAGCCYAITWAWALGWKSTSVALTCNACGFVILGRKNKRPRAFFYSPRAFRSCTIST